MQIFNERLQRDIDDFRDRVYEDPIEVLDPENVHHEFVKGNHGRKLDFDKIPDDSDFYLEWVSIYGRAIRALYPKRMPDAFVGIAGGANRLSVSLAGLFGNRIVGLTTDKLDPKTVRLSDAALATIEDNDIRFALTVEDVGTTGSTTATAVNDLKKVGVRRIESINGWQRNPTLPMLDNLRVPYSAVIYEPLPMYSPEDCLSQPDGFCYRGIDLIEHKK